MSALPLYCSPRQECWAHNLERRLSGKTAKQCPVGRAQEFLRLGGKSREEEVGVLSVDDKSRSSITDTDNICIPKMSRPPDPQKGPRAVVASPKPQNGPPALFQRPANGGKHSLNMKVANLKNAFLYFALF